MIPLLAFILLSLPVFTPFQDSGKDGIPALTKELAAQVIRFEAGDAIADDFSVLDVRQLQELARVKFSVRGREYEIRFACRKTDFGPRWRLAEALPSFAEPVIPVAPPPGQQPLPSPQPQPQAQQPVTPTEVPKNLPTYQEFLRTFIASIHRGDEAEVGRMYYRIEDFKLDAVVSPSGNPVSELNKKKAAFLVTCRSLSTSLAKYGKCVAATFFAEAGSREELLQVRALMPGAIRYHSAVSLEILLDDRLARITCEGLTLFADGWRIGGISDIELPDQQ